ncbi:MAG: caspase family protein [Gammaproteobacteria bacterium]|nr:caspase family protein [Gammaproteobacteria bacterium]
MNRLQLYLIFVLIFAAAPAAQAEARYALVIGNGAYESVDPLRNPPNDARLVSNALAQVGFNVTTLIDADLESMDRAVTEFARSLDDAGENTVGLFYFAGHGIGYQGENWLIPVNADIQQAAHLKYRTLSANFVQSLMEDARNATDMVILDACRNNPFRSFSLSGTRALSRGMTEMDVAPYGSFLAFSTTPGKVAYDGTGDYSPFAEAFAAEVATSNASIGDMMIDVRVRVKETTEQLGPEPQITWDRSSLLGKFWFNPAASSDTPTSPPVETTATATQAVAAVAVPKETAPAVAPPRRQTALNCAAGPYEFPLQPMGHNGAECQFAGQLAGLDKCVVAKVEVVVGGQRPDHISLSRSQSSNDAVYPQRTPNTAGDNRWATVNHGLNCSYPLGCGNGQYAALLAAASAARCASFEDVRLVLSVR